MAVAPALAYADGGQAASLAPLPPAGAAGAGASTVVQGEPAVSYVFLGALAVVGAAVAIGLAVSSNHSGSSATSTTAH